MTSRKYQPPRQSRGHEMVWMRHSLLSLSQMLSLSLCLGVPALAQSGGLYDAVDPVIGSSNEGNTFPGASLPFGMMQWSPQTNAKGYYFYGEKKISGFSLTHLSGRGGPIFADVPV